MTREEFDEKLGPVADYLEKNFAEDGIGFVLLVHKDNKEEKVAYTHMAANIDTHQIRLFVAEVMGSFSGLFTVQNHKDN